MELLAIGHGGRAARCLATAHGSGRRHAAARRRHRAPSYREARRLLETCFFQTCADLLVVRENLEMSGEVTVECGERLEDGHERGLPGLIARHGGVGGG